jgi:hypothetical protein
MLNTTDLLDELGSIPCRIRDIYFLDSLPVGSESHPGGIGNTFAGVKRLDVKSSTRQYLVNKFKNASSWRDA